MCAQRSRGYVRGHTATAASTHGQDLHACAHAAARCPARPTRTGPQGQGLDHAPIMEKSPTEKSATLLRPSSALPPQPPPAVALVCHLAARAWHPVPPSIVVLAPDGRPAVRRAAAAAPPLRSARPAAPAAPRPACRHRNPCTFQMHACMNVSSLSILVDTLSHHPGGRPCPGSVSSTHHAFLHRCTPATVCTAAAGCRALHQLPTHPSDAHLQQLRSLRVGLQAASKHAPACVVRHAGAGAAPPLLRHLHERERHARLRAGMHSGAVACWSPACNRP